MGFPGDSVVKNLPANAGGMGDVGLIPGLGRFPGEGKGNPLQYSWGSLVVQTVKNPPAMQETRIRSQGWKDPLEKGMATHWPGEFHGQRSLGGYSPRCLKEPGKTDFQEAS